jgi:hypothetical protein
MVHAVNHMIRMRIWWRTWCEQHRCSKQTGGYVEGPIARAMGAEGARMPLARMQYMRVAERLGCNDDVIEMRVGRVRCGYLCELWE